MNINGNEQNGSSTSQQSTTNRARRVAGLRVASARIASMTLNNARATQALPTQRETSARNIPLTLVSQQLLPQDVNHGFMLDFFLSGSIHRGGLDVVKNSVVARAA